jgi:rare lipoprotein A
VILFGFPACADPYHGTASWYKEGKITASGKKLDPNKYTAAHKTLPFGTLLKITNVKNGHTIEAIVNDRGPYKKNREVDVSLGAAKALGFFHSGTAKVLIEVLDTK